jgi:hypothetical protein
VLLVPPLAESTLYAYYMQPAYTCGGFQQKGAAIGDVFLTTGVANHDRRIPIPGFDRIGKLMSTVNPVTMTTTLGYKTHLHDGKFLGLGRTRQRHDEGK